MEHIGERLARNCRSLSQSGEKDVNMLTSAVATTKSQREMKCCSPTDGQCEPPCHPSTLQINSSGLKTPVGSRNVVSVRFCKPQLRWNETFLHVAGLISHFMLWRRRAYGLVGFRHKNYLVRVWKRSSGSQRLPKKCQSLFWQLCHLTLPPSSSIPQ